MNTTLTTKVEIPIDELVSMYHSVCLMLYQAKEELRYGAIVKVVIPRHFEVEEREFWGIVGGPYSIRSNMSPVEICVTYQSGLEVAKLQHVRPIRSDEVIPEWIKEIKEIEARETRDNNARLDALMASQPIDQET